MRNSIANLIIFGGINSNLYTKKVKNNENNLLSQYLCLYL